MVLYFTMKNYFLTSLTSLFFLTVAEIQAQSSENGKVENNVQQEEPEKSKLFNLDVLLRAGFNLYDLDKDNPKLKASLDEARILMSGDYNDRLSYKVRFRLNQTFAPTLQDNSSAALDFAFIKYQFGSTGKWAMTLGKQSAMVGSFEFENNPIYEYQFSDYVNRILNLFVVGGMVSYQIDSDHTLNLQIYNTTNQSFDQLLEANNYAAGDLKASNVPMGAYFTWQGVFAEKKFNTKWSYNISQFAQGHTNYAVSLANKFKTNRQMVYLDLQYSYYGVDHPMIASSVLNGFYMRTGKEQVLAKDIQYRSAILRYDQFLTDKWEIALKGAIETAGFKKEGETGRNFRINYTYFVALQHKPFRTQDLRFYLGYAGNAVIYKGSISKKKEVYNRISIGTYFTLPVL